MKISHERHKELTSSFAGFENVRIQWWGLWRKLADYYLPRRYIWLLSDNERRNIKAHNPFILDGTGTSAARVLASGMMNGVTSPARPWLRLRLVSRRDDEDNNIRIWLDDVTRALLRIMSESNFYNCLAVMYLDLAVFGTSAMTIYEDFEQIIHCQTHALGEYYLMQDNKHRVNGVAREFQYTVRQIIAEFGVENVSISTREMHKKGGASLFKNRVIRHIIEPNNDGKYKDKLNENIFTYREIFWEKGGEKGTVLAIRGFRELPGIFPRWEVSGNDVYGTSPGVDALGDVVQLQHETKRKAQQLDFAVRPPMVADVQLQHKPTALLPGGLTFVQGANNVGMKPAYEVRPDIQSLTADIREVQARIRETFHNDLFQMISQLDTVRSATEIDARREEKLVLLGPVLERFENEGLDPAVIRIFGLASRAGMIPEPPVDLEGEELEIQYVSILHSAQIAVSAAPTERTMAFAAEVGSVEPGVFDNFDFDELVRGYGADIGAKANIFVDKATRDERRAKRQEAEAAQQALEQGTQLVEGAKTLSETEVGGAGNALQELIG